MNRLFERKAVTWLCIGIAVAILTAVLLYVFPLPTRVNTTLYGQCIHMNDKSVEDISVTLTGWQYCYLFSDNEPFTNRDIKVSIDYESAYVHYLQLTGPEFNMAGKLFATVNYYDPVNDIMNFGQAFYNDALTEFVIKFSSGDMLVLSSDPNADLEHILQIYG